MTRVKFPKVEVGYQHRVHRSRKNKFKRGFWHLKGAKWWKKRKEELKFKQAIEET